MAGLPASPLDRQMARVRRRLYLQALLGILTWCWLVSLVCAAGWFVAEPYVVANASPSLRWKIVASLFAPATLLAVLLTSLRMPSRLTAALALDERFHLNERVTTTLTLTSGERASPAGQALLADAMNRVAPLRVGDRFPLHIPWLAALLPVAGLVLILLASFYHPTVNTTQAGTGDLLADSAADKAQIEKTLRPLQRKSTKKPGDPPKSEELQRLEAELDRLAQKPRDTKEQARELVKDLTSAEDEVRKRQKELADRVDALKAQMKQAERLSKKEQKDGPAQRFDKALDQADLKKAREEAERLGKQLQADEEVAKLRKKSQDKNLSEEEKREAREQLEKFKDQEMSRDQKERLEQQLQDVKDKLERLTRSDEAKERLQEMQRQGALSKEELERELDQLEKTSAKLDDKTKQQLQELAQKLGECEKCMREGNEGEAARKMAEAAKKLGQLDPQGESKELQQQIQRLQDARKAMCQALDGKPVPGAGERPESKDGPMTAKEERARSQLDKGRLQVLDQAPGDGFKGPRKPAEMAEEIRRASQEEPEALDRQRLPRSASDMARGYFEKLRGPDRDGKKPGKQR